MGQIGMKMPYSYIIYDSVGFVKGFGGILFKFGVVGRSPKCKMQNAKCKIKNGKAV